MANLCAFFLRTFIVVVLEFCGSPILVMWVLSNDSGHQGGDYDSEYCPLILRSWSALILVGDDLLSAPSKEASEDSPLLLLPQDELF